MGTNAVALRIADNGDRENMELHAGLPLLRDDSNLPAIREPPKKVTVVATIASRRITTSTKAQPTHLAASALSRIPAQPPHIQLLSNAFMDMTQHGI